MTFSVIGTGVIGGFYGARLARAGQEVRLASLSPLATAVANSSANNLI